MSEKMEMRGKPTWKQLLWLLLAKERKLAKVLLICENQALSPGIKRSSERNQNSFNENSGLWLNQIPARFKCHGF
jgi:hypothetical protein